MFNIFVFEEKEHKENRKLWYLNQMTFNLLSLLMAKQNLQCLYFK